MTRPLHKRLSRRELYRNAWLAVEAHEIVHPSGVPGEHILLVTPQSCGIIVEDRGELLFTEQPRFASQRPVIEIVKGGAGAGELPLECAKRELREELGLTARLWADLGSVREIPSIVDPPVRLFLARELEYGVAEPADEESITLARFRIGAALEAAVNGEIDDAVTIAALFRFAASCGYMWRSERGISGT